MGDSFGRHDPFGHLTARSLLQLWLTLLVALHVLWTVFVIFLGTRLDVLLYAAMLSALGSATLVSHPGAKIAALVAWIGWWTHRFVRAPDVHLGIVVMMVFSLYVIARVVRAWRREGAASLRVGLRFPLSSTEGWPELEGLTKSERRLVLARARSRLRRPEVFSRRFLLGLAVLLTIPLLETWLLPPPDRDGHAKTVELPRSELGVLLVALLLGGGDPRARDLEVRSLLREQVLPEFWKQPWSWDRTRREALRSRTT